MKAIVADLLLGSIFCCLIVNAPARANSLPQESKSLDKPVFLSAKVLQDNLLPITPSGVNFAKNNLDLFLSIENNNYLNNLIEQHNWLVNDNSLTSPFEIGKQHNLALGKKAFISSKRRCKPNSGLSSHFLAK